MIRIKNVKTLDGEVITHTISSEQWKEIDVEERLHILPGIIDPHICLGSIGSEKWKTGIDLAIRGGITGIIDIPYEYSTSHTKQELEDKNQKVESLLKELDIPLHYSQYLLYSDSKDEELDVTAYKKSLVKGAVIHLEHHDTDMPEHGWENLFRLAAQEDIPIVLNSFDGGLEKKSRLPIIEKAIKYTETWSNRLYVLDVSSQREIDLIQEGRGRSLLIYAETNPKQLYSDNPEEAGCLWEALSKGIIETFGSGFSLLHETRDKIRFKQKEYDLLNPLFVLPQLLTAFQERKLPLELFTDFTRFNIQNILEFDKIQDFVLVDLEREETIQKVQDGKVIDQKLIGWPAYIIVQGQIFVNSL